MTTILILLSIYASSAFSVYKYMQISHSNVGRWEGLDCGTTELFITFCPVLNTVFSFAWLFSSPYRKEEKNLNDFFKVKK